MSGKQYVKSPPSHINFQFKINTTQHYSNGVGAGVGTDY